MISLSEQSKETASGLLDILNSNVGAANFADSTPNVEILSNIYKLMVKQAALDKSKDEQYDDKNDQRHFLANRRHQEILEALGFQPKNGEQLRPATGPTSTGVPSSASKSKKVESAKEAANEVTKTVEKEKAVGKTTKTAKKVAKAKQKKAVTKTKKATPTSPVSTTPSAPATVSKTPVVPAVAVGAAAVVVSTGALAKIKSHEGFRSSAYYDPRKDASGKVLEEHYSVGYGHQITKEEINQGYIDTGTKKIPVVGKNGSDTSMSKEDAEALLKKDYEKFERYAKAIPNFSKLNAEAQMALIDMTYNMGVGWLEAKWPSLKKQLQDMDLQGAAENIRGSLYAQQTRDRAFKNAEAIQTGTKNLEPTNVPAPNNIGTNIDATSKENKQLNQDLHEQPGGSTVINQTNISSSQPQTQQRPTESSNDKSAYERKSRLK